MPDSNRYARQSFSPDGVNREFQIDVPYLREAHLALTHNDAPLVYGTDWTLANPTTIRTTAVLAAGSETLVLTRSTPVAEAVVQFVSPGSFTFGNLNRIIKQLLYGVQEAFDRTVGGEEILADALAAKVAAEAAQGATEVLRAAAEVEADAAAASAAAAATFNPSSYYTKAAADARYGQLGATNAWTGTNNFYGTTTVPTQSAGDNSFSVASTAYVDRMWTTGDVKLTWKTVADTGWIMHTDGSIGSASSGATYANAAAQALFLLLWANFADAQAPVNGGRGASAAADWAANKRISLPKAMGRAIGVAGAGAGLTSRTLGVTAGAETVAAEMPAHTHSAQRVVTTTQVQEYGTGTPVEAVTAASFDNGGVTGSASNGDGTIATVPPTAFWNVMIKL